jgi:hypothetical protein
MSNGVNIQIISEWYKGSKEQGLKGARAQWHKGAMAEVFRDSALRNYRLRETP